MMRVAAVIVVIAVIATVAWFLRPDLVEPVVEGAKRQLTERASSDTARSANASSPAPRQTSSDSARAASPSDPDAIRAEAKRYVETLSEPEPEPVSAEKADHFVTGDQVVNLLPQVAIEQTTVRAIATDKRLTPQSPITVVREVEQVERISPERLIAQSAGDLEKKVRQVMPDDSVRETTVRALLESARSQPDTPLLILKRVEHFEQTTPAELQQALESDPTQPIKVVRGAHGIELARLKDLVRAVIAVSDDSLFYVRTVRDKDIQGIWGIIHDGIIENFARGMAIRRGEAINTYQVEIPRDADEQLGQRSSFLGRLIHRKAGESFVYNLHENRMGQNPDRIYPGQEIVIVNFEPDELIKIYEHFVAGRG